MTKKLVAKTGTYTKDGQEKGRYVTIGVILSNQNGEYALLDPTVNLAGVLAKQNAMSGEMRDNVMVSIFDNDRQQAQQPQQSSGQQQSDDIPF